MKSVDRKKGCQNVLHQKNGMPSRIGGWDGVVQEPGLAREPLVEALKRELQDLEREELLWRVRTLDTPSAPHARVDGKPVLVLCSNNYLGLANHPRRKQP